MINTNKNSATLNGTESGGKQDNGGEIRKETKQM